MSARIGILSARYNYYAYQRNVINRLDDVEYVRVRDAFSLTNSIRGRINTRIGKPLFSAFDWNNVFYDANLNKVDIFHLWNGVSLGKTPWVTTFETLVPRYASVLEMYQSITHWRKIKKKRWLIKRSLEGLASNACKQIIAMSNAALRIQSRWLETCPEYADAIRDKMMVLHPPQPTPLKSFEDKKLDIDSVIQFMFVGAHFFRKGGLEILETLIKLKEQYKYPIELIIVSSLGTKDYVFPRGETEKTKYVEYLIEENASWITHYPHLPNQDVLRLMRKAHIGLLTTYADTYGYSVLEFQSMGCPVITTNVRALPEINNDNVGWVISVPKNDSGEGLYKTREERMVMSETIRNGLEQIVHKIFSNRSEIIPKANASIARIQHHHDPKKHSLALRKVYGLDS